MEKRVYDAYVSDGWKLFALYKKRSEKDRPVKGIYCTPKGWNDMSKPSDPYKDGAVYGAVPPSHIFVIDYDVKNGKIGLSSKGRLETNLGTDLPPCVISATGGGHVYVKLNGNFIPKKNQEFYPDIDFQCHGSEWVMAGGQHVEGYGDYTFDDPIEEYFTVTVSEDKLSQFLTQRNENKRDGEYGGVDEDEHFLTRPPKEEIEALLDKLDPNMSYEGGWHNVIMALNSWDMGGDEGLKLAIEWSKRSSEYDPTDEEITEKYHQSVSETPEFYKKLIGMVNRNDLKSFQSAIESAETLEEFEVIAKDVSHSTISSSDRALIGEAIAKKAKETGADARHRGVYWKKECAQNFAIAKEEMGEEVNWLDNIVYVESLTPPYYFLDTKEQFGASAAQGRYAIEFDILAKQLGMKSIGIDTILKKGLITRCSNHDYAPDKPAVFKNSDGGLTLNTYNPSNTPKMADNYTERGRYLIEKFDRHLRVMLRSEEADILLDWMAYGVQNMGKKILWAPLIQSEQGLGKSTIGYALINHCYGVKNSGTVDPDVVLSPQTAWASSKMLRVIEELRLSGQNRHAVVNRLKPLITNSTISRVEKYERSAEVDNRCNFIAFTNYKDALPLDQHDRRWWVVYSRQPSLAALEAEVGESKNDYFAPLQELARAGSPYGGEFFRWLMERDVSKFNPNFAPESMHKERMLSSENSKTEHLTELEELIKVGSQGVTEEIVSTRALKLAMMSDHWEGDVPTDHIMAQLLRKLGYSRYSGKIRYKDHTHTVWYRNEGLSNAEIKQAFHDVMELEDVLSDFDMLEEEL